MYENVDPDKLGGCDRLSLTWGLVLVWGVCAPAWGVGPVGLLVRALGKYLDPAGNVDRYGPQNPAHGGTIISGDRTSSWLVGTRGRSRVTWRLAVQFKMC